MVVLEIIVLTYFVCNAAIYLLAKRCILSNAVVTVVGVVQLAKILHFYEKG